MSQLLSMSDDERRALVERGRALVERDYTWDVSAGKMKSVYAWCDGSGPKPDCILD